jgi:thiamine-phosphate pyrophosphorylase
MNIPKLYPILDTALLGKRQFPILEAARILLESGIHLLQWRCKTAIGRGELEQLDGLAALCDKHGAALIVNDRADLAMMSRAHGVHVGQDDLPPAAVRQLMGPRALIGFSTHDRAQFVEAMQLPVDYLALGPIFATANKENPDPAVGPQTLRLCAGVTQLPVVAIGGITRGNARQVLLEGAASVAVIGDLIPESCDADSFRHRIHEWIRLLERPVV